MNLYLMWSKHNKIVSCIYYFTLFKNIFIENCINEFSLRLRNAMQNTFPPAADLETAIAHHLK